MKKSRLSDWDIQKAARFGKGEQGGIASHGLEKVGKGTHKGKHNKGLCLLCGDIHY